MHVPPVFRGASIYRFIDPTYHSPGLKLFNSKCLKQWIVQQQHTATDYFTKIKISNEVLRGNQLTRNAYYFGTLLLSETAVPLLRPRPGECQPHIAQSGDHAMAFKNETQTAFCFQVVFSVSCCQNASNMKTCSFHSGVFSVSKLLLLTLNLTVHRKGFVHISYLFHNPSIFFGAFVEATNAFCHQQISRS